MTADEIRKAGILTDADAALFLREIAAQLAELNENLRLLMSKCDVGFCLDVRNIGTGHRHWTKGFR